MSEAGFLKTGETCWRKDVADKVRIIVDGADYFPAVKQAMLSARRTIMMIGWDFDTRIQFEPKGKTLDGPNELGAFLKWLCDQREESSTSTC